MENGQECQYVKLKVIDNHRVSGQQISTLSPIVAKGLLTKDVSYSNCSATYAYMYRIQVLDSMYALHFSVLSNSYLQHQNYYNFAAG